jgi:predicted nuclease of restriction endonuclease-like (RecB) superfamily
MPDDRLPEASGIAEYKTLLLDVSQLLEHARQSAGRAVNAVMTATYWQIGRRIVEQEQKGSDRASYGEELVASLAKDLTTRFGRGFSRTNVFQMRQFYLAYREKIQTLSEFSGAESIVQTPSGLSPVNRAFPLSWSHYVRLLTVPEPHARSYYESESLRGGWSVRELDRQIASRAYDRLRGRRVKSISAADRPAADYEIRDPFVLEFLDLKDEYSESDLENALIHELERFLLELGNDFTFVARQRRLRIGTEWYRVDLLLFHRRLRCLVVIDLKIGKFTHADAGQMNLYLNYAREHWTLAEENPPVGLILSSEQDSAVAHYALEGLRNTVLAREYQLALPDETRLAKQIEETRHRLSEP